MRIELDKLEGKSDTFAHVYQPEDITLDDEGMRLTEAPEIAGSIKRSGEQVRLRGRVKAQAEIECDRCLTPINVPVDNEFDVTYIAAKEYAADDRAELQEDDLNLSVYEDEVIEVDNLVIEQVLLALPTRLLCREDCQGLCAACGLNKNIEACQCETKEIDPRWAALKDLR